MRKVEFRYSSRKQGFYFFIKEKNEYYFVDEQTMFYVMKNKKEAIANKVVGDSVIDILKNYKLDKKLVKHAKSMTCHKKGIKYNTIVLVAKKSRGKCGSGNCRSNYELERAEMNRKAGIAKGVYEWFKEGEVIIRKAKGIKNVSDKEIYDLFLKLVANKGNNL